MLVAAISMKTESIQVMQLEINVDSIGFRDCIRTLAYFHKTTNTLHNMNIYPLFIWKTIQRVHSSEMFHTIHYILDNYDLQ